MKAHGRLFELLEEWRGLTTDESEAIRALDWPKLDQCQTAKERLMSEISTKWESVNDRGIVGQRVRELIALERQNERDLVAARTKLETERVVINRATRAVRQLSQAYRSQSNANWHSYS